ncbi:13717_t:CDS:2 [Funneliformis geosporum]|uniref:19901_t:CDS:1 n=1 Tax=Funneliformis geosporum TaxID=1117311 RepID=A0A9W4SG15_9GLOM|nr:13717_t:CDS:2 [Funneliformis geosporum]CAI2168256.1 19901_t:CDS:2 [Funneliformis geosporum]
MSIYAQGSLLQTILGSKSLEINSDLDALFKNSAGPTQQIPTNGERQLKHKLSVKGSKSQKRTKVIEDIESNSDSTNEKNIEFDNSGVVNVETKDSTNLKTTELDDNDRCKGELPKVDPERLQRTIFVGNLPVAVTLKANNKKLKALFSQFGKIESVRFRSIAFSELLPRKIAFITGKLHPERDILNAYIVYKEQSSVQQAITMNAQMFMEKHLRVDSVANPQNHDRRRTVFIGNMSFDAQEEELWIHFESCGEIENVRIVRDSKTNVGKGFAYVQFKERASVEFALKLNDTKLGNRKIRVTRCAKAKHVSKLASNKPAKGKPKIGKVKFGKKLIEGIRASNEVSSNKLGKSKSSQGTHAKKGKKAPRIRTRTQAWKKAQKKSTT